MCAWHQATVGGGSSVIIHWRWLASVRSRRREGEARTVISGFLASNVALESEQDGRVVRV